MNNDLKRSGYWRLAGPAAALVALLAFTNAAADEASARPKFRWAALDRIDATPDFQTRLLGAMGNPADRHSMTAFVEAFHGLDGELPRNFEVIRASESWLWTIDSGDELSQELFLRITGKLHQLQPASGSLVPRFVGWTEECCVNIVRDSIRSHERLLSLDEIPRKQFDIFAPRVDSGRSLIRRDFEEKLMSRLSTSDRELAQWAREGQTWEAFATNKGISPAVVRQRWFQAKRRIRAARETLSRQFSGNQSSVKSRPTHLPASEAPAAVGVQARRAPPSVTVAELGDPIERYLDAERRYFAARSEAVQPQADGYMGDDLMSTRERSLKTLAETRNQERRLAIDYIRRGARDPSSVRMRMSSLETRLRGGPPEVASAVTNALFPGSMLAERFPAVAPVAEPSMVRPLLAERNEVKALSRQLGLSESEAEELAHSLRTGESVEAMLERDGWGVPGGGFGKPRSRLARILNTRIMPVVREVKP